jgi:hypothetical protein
VNAGERYFMVLVSLHSAKNRIECIINDAKEHQLVPSIEAMRVCIDELTKAMIMTHSERLSDPRFKVDRGCDRGCGWMAQHHVCQIDGCEFPR